MKSTTLVTLVLVSIVTSACCLPTRPSGEKIAAVSEVLDDVKDELNAYLASQPKVKPNTGACYDGKSSMNLTPTKITLTLKTVAVQLSEPSVGLAAPIGVVSFDPSYSGSYSQSRTQTLLVPLSVPNTNGVQPVAPGDHPIAAAISQFRDELLKVDHSKTPCLQSVKSTLKLSLAFDVVNKSTGGFSLKLVSFKLGDKETVTTEAHQTLDLEFSLAPGLLLN